MKNINSQRGTIFIFLFLLTIPEESFGAPGPIEIKLRPVGDSFVHQGMPDVNFGSHDHLWVQSYVSANVRTFVLFDLENVPPGSYVIEAYLKAHISNAPLTSRTLICERVSDSWKEGSITWNNQPPVDPVGERSNETGTVSWALISWDVKDWLQAHVARNAESYLPNYGWRIKDSAEGNTTPYIASTNFPSRESKDLAYGFMLSMKYYPPHLQLEPSVAVYAGSWAKLRVHRLDYLFRPITRGSLRVKLSSTSPSFNKKFSLTEGGPPIRELFFEEGVSSIDIWYYDDKPGTWAIRVWTTDYANYGDDNRPQVVIPDDEPPVTEIFVNSKFQTEKILYVTKNTTFSLRAVDNASGIKETKYRIDSEDWRIFPTGGSFKIELRDGFHTITYYSVDNVGNKEAEKSLTVFLDNTPPSIRTIEPNGTLARKSVSIDFKVIAFDNASGVRDVFLILDGASQGSMQRENGVYTRVIAVVAGAHKWRAESVDNLGNIAETSEVEFTLIVDVEPPMILDVFPSPDRPIMGEPIRICSSVKDDISGVKEVILHYSVDGGRTWNAVTMISQQGLYDALIPAQGAGTKVQYFVEASDFLENVAISPTEEFIVEMPIWVYAIPVIMILIIAIGLLILRDRIRKKLESTKGHSIFTSS